MAETTPRLMCAMLSVSSLCLEAIRSTPGRRTFWSCIHTGPCIYLSQPLPLPPQHTPCWPATALLCLCCLQSHASDPFPALLPLPRNPSFLLPNGLCLSRDSSNVSAFNFFPLGTPRLGWYPLHIPTALWTEAQFINITSATFFQFISNGLTLSAVVGFFFFNLLLPCWVVNSFQTQAMPY